MKMTNKFKRYLTALREASSFKSMAAIFFHLLTPSFLKNNPNFLTFDVTLKNKDGLFFCGDNIFSVFCATTLYRPDLRPYFDLDEGVFIDIGANIGKYTIIVGNRLRNTGKVIAIEPESYNFDVLRRNVKLNGLENVFLENVACFSENKEVDLYLNPSRRGQHSMVVKKADKVKVRARKLDDILSNLNFGDVRLIKIDVEGVEANVLEGGRGILKDYHPKIIFEAWDGHYLEKVKTVLNPFGYEIKQISDKDYFAL